MSRTTTTTVAAAKTPASGITSDAGGRRLPRTLHPVAWWIWALALATAVSRTNNPLLLFLVLAVLGYVITVRRTEAPWARGFKYYLYLALTVVAIRVLFRAVFATGITPRDHFLFSLPHIPTPDWYAGIQLGGPVSLEALLSAATDGLRLACMLCCIGAANTLANPKRALRVLPGALYELGVAVTVSISVAPQLVQSVQRVHRAKRLRAGRSKDCAPCGASSYRSSKTLWSGPFVSPPPWTPAATAARAPPPAAPAG